MQPHAIRDEDRRVLAYVVAEYMLNSENPPRNGRVIRWVLYSKVCRHFAPNGESRYDLDWSLFRLMEHDYIRKVNDNNSFHVGSDDMYLPTNKGMIELWAPRD